MHERRVKKLKQFRPFTVVPLKCGMWRNVYMTPKRYRWWHNRWVRWWKKTGHRVAISPEMWPRD